VLFPFAVFTHFELNPLEPTVFLSAQVEKPL